MLNLLADQSSVSISELALKLYGNAAPLNLARTICQLNGYIKEDRRFAGWQVQNQTIKKAGQPKDLAVS
ncbi:MAG: hypothetical protein HPY90_14580 [Syntrophothermus sp.]|uniref:hypothetical protein n=1 Tax=Syntrophothermus sp. TaxID=2736299 RepID=UPI00257DA5A9|nr:hypothetical protein [Syntrophothermus sp.]NSW84458.1 hypothetical protein [Syntrophothermus sp.]